MLRPMFRTAIGIVLASQRDDSEIGRMIRRVNTETERPEDAIQESEVMARINEVREKGYIITANLATPGAGVIATLLKKGPSSRPLAIGIGAPHPRIVSGKEFLVESLMQSVNKFADGRSAAQAA
jgi:DNA-binding IclR family transcriptional regulator